MFVALYSTGDLTSRHQFVYPRVVSIRCIIWEGTVGHKHQESDDSGVMKHLYFSIYVVHILGDEFKDEEDFQDNLIQVDAPMYTTRIRTLRSVV